MKVLMLHNRYRERGGEDQSSAAEVDLLRSAGVDCIFHQVDNRDVERFGASAAISAVWSRRAGNEISRIVTDQKIDVVHVQNFFPQLSPSVHWAAKHAGAAVVQSLRNYRLACLNGQFFRDGHICEDCLGRTPVRGILHRCYRQSVPGSAVVAAMLVTHRMLGTWTHKVDRFIAVSSFTRAKVIEAGLPPEKVVVKPNFLASYPDTPGTGGGGYFLYVGRLSEEKGIRTLLEAWKALPAAVPNLKLVGTGPLFDLVQSYAASMPQIEVLGSREPSEVLEIVGRAEALIFPSEWYEGHPRVTIEALAMGTPVISSDVGAVTEVIEDGVTGLRFRAGSAPNLAKTILQFMAYGQSKITMREAARRSFLVRYTAEQNKKQLLAVYQAALENNAKAQPAGLAPSPLQ